MTRTIIAGVTAGVILFGIAVARTLCSLDDIDYGFDDQFGDQEDALPIQEDAQISADEGPDGATIGSDRGGRPWL